MRRFAPIFLPILVQFAVLSSIVSAADAPPKSGTASLTVQVDKPGIKVSPTLYGIFFEEINHAGDGGLYGELINNRSFENSDKPEAWSVITKGSAKCEISIDTSKPMCDNNPRSLCLKMTSDGEAKVGVANDGYWGIAIEKDAQYDLSIALRAGDGFEGPVGVNLVSSDLKTIYCQAQIIEHVDSEWKTYKLTLTPNASNPKARLLIGSWKSGTLWMDMVSLFPHKTFKDRPNGMRLDLANMLQNIHPAFMRFPGGCWVEGEKLDQAMRWKLTIGDVAQRHNQWNLWQYYSPNGLGFHEYLQLCEDLGAEPLFVINCGMSHEEQRENKDISEEQLAEFVQDALDAIEYCNGPADSKWGSLRAKAGHPAPFNLKFMEIGNENGGPIYNKHYDKFYDAIKAKYPEMNLIANLWGGSKPKDRPIEIIDEHYYSTPEFFISNANKYDSYDRKGEKIYVGEYAVTQNCGQGNLRGAVGEAAFMTGMERNSDVVVMASYAPLFVNVNDRRWNPDLINFDSSRLYALPSYYVQKMFSENRADRILPSNVEFPNIPQEPRQGAVGVGTWTTQAEYKDIKVTKGDKTLFASDFSKENKDWKYLQGKWNVTKEGTLQQTSPDTDCLATVGDPTWSDYTITLKARKISGNEGFFVGFHFKGLNDRTWWNIGGWGNTKHQLERNTGGGNIGFGNEFPGTIETGRWYDIRVEVSGQKVRCSLDGKLIHEVEYPISQSLASVAGLSKTGDEVILKVVNSAAIDLDTDIHLAGVKSVEPTATAIVLTSENPTDENSLDNPNNVVPVTKAITNAAKDFKFNFPSNSVTIIRLKAK